MILKQDIVLVSQYITIIAIFTIGVKYMKTGRLIYNASYCIGLVLQVKDNNMSLDDVMIVLDKDYQT